MQKRNSSRNATEDGIDTGILRILKYSFKAYKAQEFFKGRNPRALDAMDLSYLTAEVILVALRGSGLIRNSLLYGSAVPIPTMQEIINDSIAIFRGDAELPLQWHCSPLEAESILSEVFFARNRRTPQCEAAKTLLKHAIARIIVYAWHRPRIETSRAQDGKRQRRYLKNDVQLSVVLEAIRGSTAKEVSTDIILDVRQALKALTELERALLEAYFLDDDATLRILEERDDWPGVGHLTIKQIRRLLDRASEKFRSALGAFVQPINCQE